jgi:hypothetical protein
VLEVVLLCCCLNLRWLLDAVSAPTTPSGRADAAIPRTTTRKARSQKGKGVPPLSPTCSPIPTPVSESRADTLTRVAISGQCHWSLALDKKRKTRCFSSSGASRRSDRTENFPGAVHEVDAPRSPTGHRGNGRCNRTASGSGQTVLSREPSDTDRPSRWGSFRGRPQGRVRRSELGDLHESEEVREGVDTWRWGGVRVWFRRMSPGPVR